jgi:penicillin-binding protein 1C
MRYKISIRKLSLCLLLLFCLLLLAWMLPLASDSLEHYPASVHLLDRDGGALRVMLGEGDARCDPVDLRSTGEWTAMALIATEDKRFQRHHGVDPLALVRAVFQNMRNRRVVSGASTITTQVIRLTHPRRRNLATKLIEAQQGCRMEQHYSKDEILAQYLNRAPFGGNLLGIQAASRRYFGKDASDLSLGEASLLVGLPQSPSRFRPDRHLKRALKRREYVLTRMVELGAISHDESIAVRRQPVEALQHANPFLAPHFCDLVRRLHGDFILTTEKSMRDAAGLANDQPAYRVRTTLCPEIQQIASRALLRNRGIPRGRDVHGAAIVVIEVSTGAVRALIGSPDYDDQVHAGQVNCAAVARSPGSALKPFAYTQAIDLGMVTPETVMGDVPMHFADYEPRNYNLTFTGPVTVREALVQSLNIPALTMVNRLGLSCFVGTLRRLGFRSVVRPAPDYGLSIILGTGEVTLLNLANAYACLARLGEYRPYCLLEREIRQGVAEGGGGQSGESRVFSEAAAYLVADILGGDERPLAVMGQSTDVKVPRVAWKTGTSSGHRDAWTVAYNPEYVVGVWIGNPDGEAVPGLNGLEEAAPVALDIFRRLYPRGDGPWFLPPAGVGKRDVCVLSGHSPNPHCPAPVETLYLRGVSDPRSCSIHQAVTSSSEEGVSVREVWPPKIVIFLERRGMARAGGNRSSPLQIVSPQASASYRLVRGVSRQVQVLHLQANSASNGELHWFVDGERLGSAPARESLSWRLQRGRHVLSCTDERGNSDRVGIHVE